MKEWPLEMGGMIGHEEQATKMCWRRVSKQKEWQFQRLEPEGVCKPQGIAYFSQCLTKYLAEEA